jgi:murein DD-endopeptidase MepM/ murein hydrolase activator NlpD
MLARMRTRMTTLAGVLLATFLSASAADGLAQEFVLEMGRERSEAFLRGDLVGIWDAMTPDMREALGSRAALAQFRNDLERTHGAEREVLQEDARREGRVDIYLRTARWTKSPAPLLMQWAFDDSDRIAGFFVRQLPTPAETRFLDYQTKGSLRLPFDGEWLVYWGGRTLEQNYHVADRAQRFASDFVIRRNGSTHNGDGADLTDYYCWDRPILAPAAGTVVAAVEGLADQPIGESDPEHPAGNHVVLALGNSEFAFLAHLREGSVAVQSGEKVSPGQEIGRCGNSGNTSEPHLHFHLQTTPDLATGEGLPAFFEDYVADGRPVDRGEPLQGQVVSPR